MTEQKRTPVRQKAKQLAKLLREENPDYSIPQFLTLIGQKIMHQAAF